MFTGLIEEVGSIVEIENLGDGRAFVIEAASIVQDMSRDDSIAVNGVCLTVTDFGSTSFRVTAVAQTLHRTTLRDMTIGRHVNLERAVRLKDRLGGHLVQGHIDTTGVVASIDKMDQGSEMWIAFPTAFRKWLVPVGSVCVNGVSLTVADLTDNQLKVAVIPHTLQVTTLWAFVVGQEVNLEFDVIAKYVESILVHNSV
ncbi:MAG: riboflavin synthase [bacterium]|nr:riboflavin synthase [bacterium]